jgi:uncharacterized protein (TIRG00374 family)
VTVLALASRWRVLLSGARPGASRRVLFAATVVRQSANSVMPFQLGDAFRIAAVSHRLGVPAAVVLGSVAAERFYDAVASGAVASLLVAGGRLPGFARTGMIGLCAFIAAALAALLILRASAVRSGIDRVRIPGLPSSVATRVAAQLRLVLEGLRYSSSGGVLPIVLILSGTIFVCSVLTAVLVMRAFDLGAPLISAVVLVIVLQVGNVVAPVPGAIGVSQALTASTLALWGVPEATGLAFAVALYVVSRLPKILLLPSSLRLLGDANTARAGL